MKMIRVRYLPCTNTKAACYVADIGKRPMSITHVNAPFRIRVSASSPVLDNLTDEQKAARVALVLARQMNWVHHRTPSHMIGGEYNDAYYFIPALVVRKDRTK